MKLIMGNTVSPRTRSQLIWQAIKKGIMSKLFVVTALLAFAVGAYTVVNHIDGQSDSTGIAQTYQYYLLANSKGTDSSKDAQKAAASTDNSGSNSQGSSGSVAKGVAGLLGNGGNSGSFKYSDIISGAPSGSEANAKKFSVIMATLSGFNYISTQSQSFSMLLSLGGRFLIGIIFVFCGVVIDTFDLFKVVIIDFIAKYNVFSLLATMYANSPAGEQIAKLLGITTDFMKQLSELALGAFASVLVWSITRVFIARRGINQSALSKLWGRIVSFVGLPIIVVMACMLLSDFTTGINKQNLADSNSSHPDYANWLMDVQTWADSYNFDVSAAGLSLDSFNNNKQHGSYVDDSFNPYPVNIDAMTKGTPASRIGQNLYSSGLGRSHNLLPNSTMALSYMTSETFDARDYLAALESGSSRVNGNIPRYAKNKKLYDFSKYYTSTGDGPYEDWNANSAQGPMSKAKDDYGYWENGKVKDKSADEAKVWEDRYIYGAKNSGSHLKDYYKAQPSHEQIYSGTATGNGTSLTDESTFLALSTKFTPNGGQFSLDGPTYGAYATFSKFDSQRYAYYKYSMVGTPMFTIPAMLYTAIIDVVVAAALIIAILDVGLLDMNMRPLRVWFKGMFAGGIEYFQAEIIYTLGICGTVLALYMSPDLIKALFDGVIGIIGSLVTGGGSNTTTTSLMMNGICYWVAFSVSIMAAWLFKNNKNFRDRLVNLMILPWDIARDAGQAFEDRAAGYKGALNRAMERSNRKNQHRNAILEDLNGNRTHGADLLNRMTKGKAGDMAGNLLSHAARNGNYNTGDGNGFGTNRDQTMDAIRRAGAQRRMENNMDDLKQAMPDSTDASKMFDENAQDNLTPDKLMKPDGTFDPDNEYLSEAMRDKLEGFNNGVTDMGDQAQAMSDLETEGATGLTKPQREKLDGLEDMATKYGVKPQFDTFRRLTEKSVHHPLSNKEQKRLDSATKDIEKYLGADNVKQAGDLIKAGEKKAALTTPQQKEFAELQKLATAERSRAPLTDGQQQKYDNLMNIRRNAIHSKMPQEAYQELKKLQNKGTPMTDAQKKRYEKLLAQANQIGNGALTPDQQADFKKLDRQAKSLMTAGQKNRYKSLSKVSRRALDSNKNAQYGRLLKDWTQNKQNLANQKAAILDNVLNPAELQKAKSEFTQNSAKMNQNLRQVHSAYRAFAQRGNESAAANLVNNLNKLNKDSHIYGGQRKQIQSVTDHMVDEIKRYDFNQGAVDLNGDGHISAAEQQIGSMNSDNIVKGHKQLQSALREYGRIRR